mmetsp:Transcript_57084/g.131060  ORF Transcript_57084/g.131060 Transcript_57084/m.131060 type:complete len:319 (-) Transcript_57084:258-1214(-)
MLADLKNNRQRARGVEDARLPRMQKMLRNEGEREMAAVPTALKAGWDELVYAQERGRWWLVGSAWAGRASGAEAAVGERAAAAAAAASSSSGARTRESMSTSAVEEKLLQLASAQRMNTEARKDIFVAITGADDYVDAFERLNKLRIPKTQRAEVVRVVLHCCGQEKVYNPFYALVAARLCAAHREYRFAFHFVLWDTFKELKDLPLRRAANVAKLLAEMLGRGALPMTVLKTVLWHKLDERGIFFWHVCFVDLLAAGSKALQQAAATLHEPTYATLRDGILLFVSVHLRPLITKSHAALIVPLDAFAEAVTSLSAIE